MSRPGDFECRWVASGIVRITGQVLANGPNKYHTLSPVEGPILILGTIGLYAAINRRVMISAGRR